MLLILYFCLAWLQGGGGLLSGRDLKYVIHKLLLSKQSGQVGNKESKTELGLLELDKE